MLPLFFFPLAFPLSLCYNNGRKLLRYEVSTMFFFKKKYPAAAKYKEKDFVNFYHRGEMRFAWVYDAKVDKSGAVFYTMQVGGQCPALVYDVPEGDIIGLKED